MGDADELLHRRADHPGGGDGDGRGGFGGDRQHRLGQRLLPAGRRDDRLRRRQGSPGHFAKTLSQEFGPKGIRVNSVSPGPVATDLWLGEHGVAETVAAASGTDAATAREQVVAGIGGFATGKFTQPEEVANIVAFLASDRSANVTGANYLIDGGLIKTT